MTWPSLRPHCASRVRGPAVRRGVLAGAIIFAAVLRLWHLGSSPGWFLDEGTYFDVTRHLLQGRRWVGEMEVSFVAPHMTAPPALFVAEAAWMSIVGVSMTAFRTLVALSGIACVTLLLGIARRLAGWSAAVVAVGFLTVAPRAVLYSRLAIPYMPATFLVLLWLYALLRAEAEKNPGLRRAFLVLACLAASVAPLTLYYAVVIGPVGVIWAGAAWLRRQRVRTPLSPGFLLLPSLCAAAALGIFLFVGWFAWSPTFRTDLRAFVFYLQPASLAGQLAHWRDFLVRWTSETGFLEALVGALPLFGFVGLLFLRRGAASLAVGAAAFAFAHIVLRRADARVAFIDYPMVPVLPFLCLGWAALFVRLPSLALRVGLGRRARKVAAVVVILVAMLPISHVAGSTGMALASRWTLPYPPTLSFGMIHSLANARAATRWVNAHLRETNQFGDRVVLASSNLWPLLEVPHSDANQLMGARDGGSGFYEYPCASAASAALRAERIAVVIEDSFTDLRRKPAVEPTVGIGPGNPWIHLAQALQEFHTDWPVAFESGEYRVHVPPDSALIPSRP